jgi:heat shock protein HslJ
LKKVSLRWLIPTLLIPTLVAVLVLGSLPAPLLAAPTLPAIQQETATSDVLTPEALANLTYQSELAPTGEVTLVDGEFEDADNRYIAVLASTPQAFGQIDGQDAAAVLLGENTGGSGIFVRLAVVLDQDGTPINVATTLLGDRVDVYTLAIDENGVIAVEMVRQGPNDPMCCPTEVVRILYTLDGDQLVATGDPILLGSGAQVALDVAPEAGYQINVVPATPYDLSGLIPTGAPIHTLLTAGTDDAATIFAAGGPYIAIYPVQEYIDLWQAAGDATIANLVADLQTVLAEQPATLSSPLPIAPPAEPDDLAAQVSYLAGDGYTGVRFVGRATPSGAVAADDQLAYYFSGLTDDGRYLIAAQWPVATTAAIDALDTATDEAWTPTLSSLDATLTSLIFQDTEALTVEELANTTYNSLLLEEPVLLSGGIYTQTGESGGASDVTTVQLLSEPVATGQVEGVAAAAVLLVENGGGTGQFINLALVQDVGGTAANTANAFLGDRTRVTNLAINDDGAIVVDMIQAGPNDAACCPNMPMSATFVKVGNQLVYEALAAAAIDASSATTQVTAFVVQPTAYDNTMPPSGQGEPKHFTWAFGDVEDVTQIAFAGGGYVSIYPVDAYQAIWDLQGDPFVADTLAALEELLTERPENPAPPLPILPQMAATNDFAAQVSYLDLADGGAGVRFVGRFAQDVSPIENYQLRYVFQGLSGDGQFLIVAQLPITTTALSEEAQALEGDAYNDFAANYETYLAETTATFDSLATSDFTPDLAVLDAMLLSVTPEFAVNPLAPSSLANMEVNSELTADGVALLENGVYTETVAPDSASVIEVQLLPWPIAYGVLNEQDAAAVLIAESGGGSGVFINLAVIVDQDGMPLHVASAPLGDRVVVQSLAIADNQITVEMLTPRPNDPLCCPSRPVTQVYELQDDALVLVDESSGLAESALAGTSWVWSMTQMSDGAVKSPATEGVFTLTFGDDGTASATTDCNTFNGTYTEGADGVLIIDLPISTRMACPDGSQEQEFIADVTSISRYIITEEGVLALLLPVDSGSMLFAPANDATNDTAVSDAAASDTAPTSLPDTRWAWVQTQYGNDTVIAPPDSAAYVLTFGADGTVNLQDDCNVVNGAFTADEHGALALDLQTSTFAACLPESKHDQFVLDLSGVASYLFQDGSLFLAIKYDTGVMEFAPAE